MKKQSLKGKVALVTGATRGIGRGIAIQLGEAGALVYITGRTLKSTNGLGSLEETANEIRNRGGNCIPVQVDHENDVQIASLFQKIESEQDGQLDVLINNAYKGVQSIFENVSIKFWETKPEIWDDINNVGLRNHYICTVYAARMMVPRKQGLIVNISSMGGVQYIFNVAYGVGKAACDRMAVDCGIELKKHNVTMISLYPGPVKTEMINHLSKNHDAIDQQATQGKNMKQIFENGESTEFSGKIIVSLLNNPNLHKYTSKVIYSSDYADSFGIKDIDGRVIPNYKQLKFLASSFLPKPFNYASVFIPGFLKIPQFLLDIVNSKF